MRKEDEILIKLSRLDLNETQKDEIVDMIEEGIDWGYFVLNCFFQKVCNIVYYHFLELNVTEKVRDKILSLFRIYYIYSSKKNEMLKNELCNIVNILNMGEIPYALLKGFALVEKVYKYKSTYIREFDDIDILISQDHISRVTDLLIDYGYIQGDYNKYYNEIKFASRAEKIGKRLNTHEIYPFVKKVICGSIPEVFEVVEIDINHTIFEGGNISPIIPTKRLLLNVEKIPFCNNNYFYTLDSYYFFIQLAYHLYKETNYQLKKNNLTDLTLLKFCDIREIVKKMKCNFDWSKLRDIIIMYKLNNAVYFTLLFTELIYCDLDIDWFLEAIKPDDRLFLDQIDRYKNYFFNNLFKKEFNKIQKLSWDGIKDVFPDE